MRNTTVFPVSTGFVMLVLLLAGCSPEATTVQSEVTADNASTPVRATMHPSWDADGNGINDCENDGSCDHTVDYTVPRTVTTVNSTNP